MPKGKHVRIPHFSITLNFKFNDLESMKKCVENGDFQKAQGILANIALAKGAKKAEMYLNPELDT